MKNHSEKRENYAMFYEWFLEKAMSEVVCIDTRRISECCVWIAFVQCMCWLWLSVEWIQWEKSGYCMCSIFVIFMSHYECVSIVIVREKMTLRLGGERWIIIWLMDYANFFYFYDFSYIF